jgi:hypothetical protein
MWNRKCEVHDEHILNINRLESKIQEAQQQMRTIVREPAECEEGSSKVVIVISKYNSTIVMIAKRQKEEL